MTVKDKYIHKFYAFAMAAVFALVLAGCGGGGGGTAEQPMTGPTDAERIASAQMAATTAAGVAAAALAAVEANQSADLDSYIRASIANDNAQAALEAANAATTPAAAEAAQAEAEAASADAQKYAGMVTTAHNALEAARMELMALNDARAAAMKAYMDARAALDEIAGQGDADSDSYDMAVVALAAALMANDAAQAAETSDAAEAAQADAEAALADVQKYAGMVTTAHMEATALSTAQQAAMDAYMAAKAALMAAEADKDEDIASYTRAEDAVADAKAASDEAAAATTSAAAQAAQAKAEAARDAANGFIAMIATAKSDREEMERMAAAKAAANKVALTKKAAIETEGDSTTTLARPFDLATAPTDSTAPTADENYVVSVKHTGSAVEVEVTDGALPADNDPMYKQVATFGNGQMLVRNIGTDRKIIVLHTDIEAPDQVAFSSEYTLTVDRDTDTTANDTYAVLADDNGKIASSRFPDDANQSQTYVVYDADTATGRASQFSGMFDGASGMFRCVASGGCTVSTDAMGKINALTAGEWEFTPSAGATVAKPDGDYLTYGFWLDTKTKDGNVSEYETVQTFAMSSLDASTGLSSVTGKATYEGGAAGVYVHETSKEDGTLDTATSGRFTADVSLKAHFSGDPLRTAGTMEGTISNFDLDGGPANKWNVNVTATGIGTDGGFTGSASGMSGDDGSLSGSFHGAGDATDATVAPPVLIGEFNANFVNGTAAGAFGARKQ